jgi:hypothetical protein
MRTTHLTVGSKKARARSSAAGGLGYQPFRGCTVAGGL